MSPSFANASFDFGAGADVDVYVDFGADAGFGAGVAVLVVKVVVVDRVPPYRWVPSEDLSEEVERSLVVVTVVPVTLIAETDADADEYQTLHECDWI